LALQLIAVCIGGRTLAILCYCMSKNYKQLSSGAPDLFLIRIKKRKVNMKSNNGNNVNGVPWHEDNEQFEIVPLEFFFGNDWKSHSSNRRSMNQRNNYRSSNNRGQDDLLTAEYNAPKKKNAFNDNKNNRNYQNEGDSMKKADDKKNFKRLSSVFFKSPTIASKTVPYDTIKQEDDKNNSNNKTNHGSNELIDLADDDSCEEIPPKEQEQDEQVTVVAEHDEEKEDQHLQNEDQPPPPLPKELLQILSEDDLMSDRYYFESSCIEVKGPTDHLAYKQLFWLQVLSLPMIHSTMTAFVGHVREEKQK
jgi:hypothetical protein